MARCFYIINYIILIISPYLYAFAWQAIRSVGTLYRTVIEIKFGFSLYYLVENSSYIVSPPSYSLDLVPFGLLAILEIHKARFTNKEKRGKIFKDRAPILMRIVDFLSFFGVLNKQFQDASEGKQISTRHTCVFLFPLT